MANSHAIICCLFVSLWKSSAIPHTGKTIDLCKVSNLRLSTVGETGRIVIQNTSINNDVPNPCILKIDACSSCNIELRPEVTTDYKFYCHNTDYTNHRCSYGCDYIYMFDRYYMNETLKYYNELENFEPFKSTSSSVYIGLCHGHKKDYQISLIYNATLKQQAITGSSSSFQSKGYFQSPFFPTGYAENHETYEFRISSTYPNDYIFLTFDDWHLAESSALYFENSNNEGPITGESSRPVVISNTHTMLVVFNTGQPLIVPSLVTGNDRQYMGFKASYRFVSTRQIIPQTNCHGSGYLLKKLGGVIEFKSPLTTKEVFDCIWVIKTQPDFDGVFLRPARIKTHGYSNNRHANYIDLRSGLTSNGPLRTRLDLRNQVESGVPHTDSHGFYIRLNASIESIDIQLVYASYKNGAYCDRDSSLFKCSSGDRCISKGLVCDGHNHCEDNSDETEGCKPFGEPWDKSYQYTITVGIIVPMVISVFLIMVICLLFVMIRRCRRARLREAGSAERLRTVSEDVTSTGRRGRRRRRHRRNWFGTVERDQPPSYDEAMQNPPGWYLNVAFGNPADPSLPCPPSYSEAVGDTLDPTALPSPQTPGSPSSTDSSQSEVTMCSHNQSSSSDSSEGGTPWATRRNIADGRRARLGRHISSSESEDDDVAVTREVSQAHCVVSSPSNSSGRLTTTHSDNISADPSISSIGANITSAHDINVQKRGVQKTKSSELNDEKEHKSESDKMLSKAVDDPTQFVIPDKTKPGNTDDKPSVRPKAMPRRTSDSVNGPHSHTNEVTPSHSRNHHSHNRSISSESDMMPEQIKKNKKRSKKTKSRKPKPNSPKSNEHRNDTDLVSSDQAQYNVNLEHNQHEVDATYPIDMSMPSEHLGDSDNNNTINNNDVGLNVVDPSAGNVKLDESDKMAEPSYEMVVNVDNDDVLVVYDNESLHQATRNLASPPQYLLSSAIPMETPMSVDKAHENNEITVNSPQTIDHLEPERVDNSVRSVDIDEPGCDILNENDISNSHGNRYINSDAQADASAFVEVVDDRDEVRVRDGGSFNRNLTIVSSDDPDGDIGTVGLNDLELDMYGSESRGEGSSTGSPQSPGSRVRYINLYRQGEEDEDVYV